MVVFPPPCDPTVLDAYSTVPLVPSLRTSVLHDFGVGSFARFPNPITAISIHDRPDFHSLSHYDIRQRLDAEGHEDGFIVIDEDTASKHAVWWITSTSNSKSITEDMTTEADAPPITYPEEAYTLWKLHLLTQDLPIQWTNWDIGNIDIVEDIAEAFPYDPHAPQDPPFTLGFNFSNKEGARGFYYGPDVIAAPGEYEASDDVEPRSNFMPRPPWVLRLTAEAAREAGLLVGWSAWFGNKPGEGESVRIHTDYDWDSPKWAWDGLARGIDVQTARLRQSIGRLGRTCKQRPVVDISALVDRLPWARNRPALAQDNVATS
ncbi:MAG: hypothetical protein Q9174_002978 [Haloplaca sp. 1 TL-2023]